MRRAAGNMLSLVMALSSSVESTPEPNGSSGQRRSLQSFNINRDIPEYIVDHASAFEFIGSWIVCGENALHRTPARPVSPKRN